MEKVREPVSELRDFSGGYKLGEPVVSCVSATFEPGAVTSVIGPNGAGKSSLLRGLAGLLPWSSGRVNLCGEDVGGMPRRTVARKVALMGAKCPTSSLSIFEYVMLGRTPHRSLLAMRDSAADKVAVSEALASVGLPSLAHLPMSTLSDGQRQLACLARSLVQSPRLLLLDEPTSSLDPANSQIVLSHVVDVTRKAGIATVAVMHDVNLARRWSDFVLILRGGQLLRGGRSEDVVTADALSEAYGVPFERCEAFLTKKHSQMGF